MAFFRNFSKNNSCKGANDFAASFSPAENVKKFDMAAIFADTAVAVSVLFFVIICHALIIPGFLIICAIIINYIIIKQNLRQNTVISHVG